jgi:Tol biopolymer transport system component
MSRWPHSPRAMSWSRRSSIATAALLALASAACEDPGVGPGPEPEEHLLFLSTRDGATDEYGPLSEIYRMNADGTGVENLTRQPGLYHGLSLSPDGSRVLFVRVPGCDVWVMNVDGTGQSRLTGAGTEDRCNAWPHWSPDGTRIAFATNREGRVAGTTHGAYDVYVMNADGSNPHNVSSAMNAELGQHVDVGVVGWSPAGQVVFQGSGVLNGVPFFRVYVVNADGTGARALFAGSRDHSPAWSPDGSKVVFISGRDGTERLYMMNADGTGERALTAHAGWDYLPGVTGGGSASYNEYSPWSPDGSRIAFLWDGRIHVMNADGSGLRRLADAFAGFNGWSPDGTRIACTSTADGNKDVYTVYSGGSEPVKLTSTPAQDRDALWTSR